MLEDDLTIEAPAAKETQLDGFDRKDHQALIKP